MASGELAKLDVRRTILRDSARKMCESLREHLDKDDVDENEVEYIFDTLTQKHSEIQGLNSEVMTFLDSAEDVSKEMKEVESFEELILRALHDAKKFLRVGTHSSVSSKASGRPSKVGSRKSNRSNASRPTQNFVKLPTMQLPVFDGDVFNWLPFWDSFSATIDDNTEVPEVMKFAYLKGQLKGEASRAIEGLSLSAANYKVAISLLKERYGKPDMLHAAHSQQIVNLKVVESVNDVEGLRKLHNACEIHIRGIESLEKPNQKSQLSVFVPLILGKLPEELVVQWHKDAPKGKEFDLRSLLRYLLKDIEGRENCRLMKRASSTPVKSADSGGGGNYVPGGLKSKYKPKEHRRNDKSHSQPRDNPPTGAALHSAVKRSCIFCGSEEHVSYKCSKIDDMGYKQRVEKVKEAGACFRCFRCNHHSRDCQLKSTIKCATCKGDHHTFFCKRLEYPVKKGKTGETKSTVTTSCVSNPKSSVILQTAKVIALGENSKSREVICLFDTGSDRSYVSSQLASDLELSTLGIERVSIGTFGTQQGKSTVCPRVSLDVLSAVDPSSDDKITVSALAVEVICHPLKRVQLAENSPIFDHFSSQEFADDYLQTDKIHVDILIGSDLYWDVLTGPIYRYENAPVAIQSRVGLILHGPIPPSVSNLLTNSYSPALFVNTIDDDSTHSLLKNFWELDSMGIASVEEAPYTKSDLEAIDSFQRDIEFSEGRYSVRFPWKSEYELNPENVPHNKHIAKKRLSHTVQKLKKDPELLRKYHGALEEFVDLGFTEMVPDQELEPSNKAISYLPHRPVVKQERSTTKIRPVFDASAHEKGKPSLNDCILIGPSLNPEILALLLKFRVNPVALVGDLEKAFPQIKLDARDIDATRFLWFDSVEAILRGDEPREFRMKRVLFGINASPFLLNATIKHHLEKYPHESTVLQELKQQLYVDDWISGGSSTEEVYSKYSLAKDIMSAASFHMRKWKTNDPELRNRISDSDDDSRAKVLGMEWDFDKDQFGFDLSTLIGKEKSGMCTKRMFLSHSSKLYDPLGLLSPFSIRVKLLFQMMWRKGTQWDDSLPQEIQVQWDQWVDELDDLVGIQIPRCVLPLDTQVVEVHGFCDSSKVCFAAVIYIRVSSSSSKGCQLLVSKTRVAPIKQISLPRLELMGAVLLTRLLKYVHRSIPEISEVPYFLWTDSRIVYHWIRGSPSDQKVFVSNRVSEIQTETEASRWKFCPGAKNPADLPTRGISAQGLVDKTEWWHGPEWIHDENSWPNQTGLELESQERLVMLSEQETSKREPVREVNFVSRLLESHSSYNKVLRFLAYYRRFVLFLVSKYSKNTGIVTVLRGPVQAEEMNIAEVNLVRVVQREVFPEEYTALEKGEPIDKESKLAHFSPCFDQAVGIIRVGGRIGQSELSEEQKHPIILPSHHRFVELYVFAVHSELKHPSVRNALVHSRQRFWIIRGRQTIRNYLSQCMICKRYKAMPYQVKMGPLPRDRVTRAPAFDVVGIDFAGPLYVTLGKKKVKAYICLYTCAVTRAVHLELTESLCTEDFLLSFRRFVARRGLCSTVYSDNAGAFLKGNEELKKLWENIDKDKLESYASSKRISWKFIVPRSPWWGGFYERLVRSIKEPLRKVLGDTRLTFLEMETILCEVEALVNSRPLTFISDDPAEWFEPLTPSHFLVGKRLTQLPPVDIEYDTFSSREILTRKRRFQENLLDVLWGRWSQEYLVELSKFQKWLFSSVTPKLEDIVLVGESNTRRQHWRLGQILKIHQGSDGEARYADVRTGGGLVVRRAVQKLYIMEAAHDREAPDSDNAVDSLSEDKSTKVSDPPQPIQDEATSSVGREDVAKQRRSTRKTRKPTRFKDYVRY